MTDKLYVSLEKIKELLYSLYGNIEVVAIIVTAIISSALILNLIYNSKSVLFNEKNTGKIISHVFKLIHTPGFIVFVFSILTIYVYKARP